MLARLNMLAFDASPKSCATTPGYTQTTEIVSRSRPTVANVLYERRRSATRRKRAKSGKSALRQKRIRRVGLRSAGGAEGQDRRCGADGTAWRLLAAARPAAAVIFGERRGLCCGWLIRSSPAAHPREMPLRSTLVSVLIYQKFVV